MAACCSDAEDRDIDLRAEAYPRLFFLSFSPRGGGGGGFGGTGFGFVGITVGMGNWPGAFGFAGVPGATGVPRPLRETESPKMTRPFAGRLRTAVAQSVGAACLAAGTLGSQIRHIPGGGC